MERSSSGQKRFKETPKIRRILPLFIIILTACTCLPGAHGLGIGPPSLSVTVPADGFNTTTVYVTADGLSGNLFIGTEGNQFKVEPERFTLSPDDVNVPLKLTIYGNETLTPGLYVEKLTFIAFSSGSVAVGIKVKAEIEVTEPAKGFTLLGLSMVQLLGLAGLLILIVLLYLYRGRFKPKGSENER